jgi:hypothetical protein
MNAPDPSSAPGSGPSASGAPGTFDDGLLAAFESAQSATIRAVRHVVAELKEGQSEVEIARALESAVRDQGFHTWFQRPRVQLGAPAAPRRWMEDRPALREGTLVELHLAPANQDAFGALGAAFAFGGGPEPLLLQQARELCRATCGFASRWKCTGELYVYAQAWANNRRLQLDTTETVGHVCFPRRGRAGWLWPYGARTAALLRRHQIQWFNHRRMHGVFHIAPRLVSGSQGLTVGELVLIDGDRKRIIGRAGPDEVGRL